MKKTLMAVAVGAAFAAPAAYADVTISGSINMGLYYEHSGQGANTTGNNLVASNVPVPGGVKGVTTEGVSTNYSNVTISSLDDIGGGNKVDFAYQITAPTANNANVQNRNSHIGIVGDSWGGVWYGSNENIYERYLYTIDPLDGAAGMGGNLQMMGTPGYGHVFEAPTGSPGGTRTGTSDFYHRTENTVWYDSPNFNGFTGGIAWQMPAYKSNASPLNPSMVSLGLKYASPAIPLAGWLAYETRKDYNGLGDITTAAGGIANSAINSSKDQGWHAGVSYTLGDIALFGGYEQLKYNSTFAAPTATDVSTYKVNHWYLGLKWNLATGYLGAQYIGAGNASCEMAAAAGGCSTAGAGAKMLAIGYYHTLSKQSQAYVVLNKINNNDNASYVTAGVQNPTNAPGASQTGVTIGLKHSF